jgi:hypothetical protein
MAVLVNNATEVRAEDAHLDRPEDEALLYLADTLLKARLFFEAVELGLLSETVDSEVSDPLLCVLEQGLINLRDVAGRLDLYRVSITPVHPD